MMAISTGLANLTCVGFTVIYVAGFYLFKTTGSRNDPRVIRARMKAVAVASFISMCIVYQLTDDNLLVALGLMPSLAVLKPVILTMLLFLGPLSIMYFDRELFFQSNFDFKRDLVESFTQPLGQRNYIVAPLTEEFVFRACMIATLHQADYSRNYLIFASPLYFGLAHLHHVWENYHALGKTKKALRQALCGSLFQFAYTSVFGWYVSYLFLKTGSLWPSVLCHSFCNIMGFPDFSRIQDQNEIPKRVTVACFPIGVILFVVFFQSLSDIGTISIYWK
ncbi:CAAX protease self-immunity-domain-containing protein [Sporodiniella umbellata]|nr:CAAX protease self-immunity-domain-containing protein [Sporodiniella umbellata]